MEMVESVKMNRIPKKGRESFLALNILTILPLEDALSLRFVSRDTLFLGILSVRGCVHPEIDNLPNSVLGAVYYPNRFSQPKWWASSFFQLS